MQHDFSCLRWLLPLTAVLACSAHAVEFSLPATIDEPIGSVLNTTITAGVAIRTQSRSSGLIGKANLNPNVCSGPNGAYQSCQGLFKDQIYPAQVLVRAPGAASMNGDDGDLNYGVGARITLTRIRLICAGMGDQRHPPYHIEQAQHS